jgi:HEAT repeat protein
VSFLFPSSTITFDAAMRDLVQGSPKARAMAAQALGDVTDPTEKRRAVDALIRALEDDRPEVRAEACGSLGSLEEPLAIPGIVKRLDDGVPVVRQHAAIALGSLRHADGFAPLATALREGPADLRFQAATSLAEIDAARAYDPLDPLVAALGDADPQVVGAAALSLGAIGDARARPLVAAVLGHADAGARFDAAYALAELGDPAGLAILADGIGEPERAWDAITALGVLGGLDPASRPSAAGDGADPAPSPPARPDDRAQLGEAMGRALTLRKVPPEATVLAAGTLLRVAPESRHHDAARRVLLAALNARKVHVRGLAVEQLGAVGGPWARAPLDKLARSGKGGEVLEAIAQALRAIEERERGSATEPAP